MADYTILQPIHLGSGELGRRRKEALEAIAVDNDCFWNGEPSIGRWLIQVAIAQMKKSMNEIVQEIVEAGRASTQEELTNQFKFDAHENDWSEEEIRDAINSPWFPVIE